MAYTPYDIINYIYEQGKEVDFMTALASNRNNYSIGEITDREFRKSGTTVRFASKTYKLDLPINDDIITAVLNELYVSAFISRHNDDYQVHFLVHQYPISMKKQFDEEILREVIRYMVLKTVVALRLDTPEKVDKYLG